MLPEFFFAGWLSQVWGTLLVSLYNPTSFSFILTWAFWGLWSLPAICSSSRALHTSHPRIGPRAWRHATRQLRAKGWSPSLGVSQQSYWALTQYTRLPRTQEAKKDSSQGTRPRVRGWGCIRTLKLGGEIGKGEPSRDGAPQHSPPPLTQWSPARWIFQPILHCMPFPFPCGFMSHCPSHLGILRHQSCRQIKSQLLNTPLKLLGIQVCTCWPCWWTRCGWLRTSKVLGRKEVVSSNRWVRPIVSYIWKINWVQSKTCI